MGDTPTFMIKGDARTFVMGDRMGDVFAFVIKGGTPLATRVSFTCIIGDVTQERTSPFYHRSGHVLNINLTETGRKEDHLLFTLH
jgi:hypothetical protein